MNQKIRRNIWRLRYKQSSYHESVTFHLIFWCYRKELTNKKRLWLSLIRVICKTSAGNEKAVKGILMFYDAYISKLCLGSFYRAESGKISMQVDEELKSEIYTKTMKAILEFEIRVK